jgi:CubicO group peptidase (beta-lactamase class C family)
MQHTLEWEYTPDYELLGLASPKGCHRLAWAMNRAFGWQLQCDLDVVVAHSSGAETVHPSMRFVDEEAGIAVTLVLNRLPEGMLAKGASGLDYLMMVNHHELAAHEIVAKLRALPEISFVTVLDPASSGAMEPLTLFD